jgi:tetratricopeptide (TPR) repeat protein
MKINNKQIAIALFLSLLFIALLSLLVSILAANIQFNLARKHETKYLWDKAAHNYQKAIKLAPLSSEYMATYAKFLTRISKHDKDRLALLNKAEKLYKKALKQDPLCAQYWLCLGEIQLEKFSASSDDPTYLMLAVSYFRKAFKNDPYGESILEGISYSSIEFLPFFAKPDSKWILDKIKKVLQQKYHDVDYLYAVIQQNATDMNLLKDMAKIR